MDETIFVSFTTDEPISRKNLISDIKELQKTSSRKSLEDSIDTPAFSIAKTEKKKQKKPKKKNKVKEPDFITFGGSGLSLDEVDYDDIANKELIDIEEIFYGNEEDDDLEYEIINKERNKYDKRKKDDNPFKKEFAEEMTLLYGIYDDVNKFSKEIESRYKQVSGAKVRGANKYAGDLTEAMLSAFNMKLSVTKEIVGLKKTQADLNFKREAKDKNNNAANSTEAIATQYFQNVLKHGRSDFINTMNSRSGGSGISDHDEFDDAISRIENEKMMYTDHENDEILDMIENRLETEGNPMRSAEGSAYIAYENRDVKPVIKRCIDTNEWDFIAVDRDGQVVNGYPLPNPEKIGKIKFSDDGRFATDERGRSYKVFEYYSDDDE